MVTLRWTAGVVLWLVVEACASTSIAPPPSSAHIALPVTINVTNESGLARRVQLRIGGVVVVDSVVGRPSSINGLVLTDTVRLVPGEYELILEDHQHGREFNARLTVRSGPMCILISLMGS